MTQLSYTSTEKQITNAIKMSLVLLKRLSLFLNTKNPVYNQSKESDIQSRDVLHTSMVALSLMLDIHQ